MSQVITKLDTQQIEVVGRSAFIAAAVQAGFEVAVPERDDGIDLIVYLKNPQFKALPVQLKVNSVTKQRWGLHQKYEKVNQLVLAYVWLAPPSEVPTIILMSYQEAFDLLGAATSTASWLEKGAYTCNVGGALLEKLSAYRDRWDWLRMQLEGQPIT